MTVGDVTVLDVASTGVVLGDMVTDGVDIGQSRDAFLVILPV